MKKQIILFLTLFLISTSGYFYFSHYLNLEGMVLKKGPFIVTGQLYDFEIKHLLWKKYNADLILDLKNRHEIWGDEEIPLDVNVVISLRDNGNSLVQKKIKFNSAIARGWEKSLPLRLFSFNGKLGHQYNLSLTFESKDYLLENIPTEIRLTEDYDVTILPVYEILKNLSLYLSLVFLLLTIIPVLIRHKHAFN